MILICPSCGATHSAEAWANDAEARTAMLAMANMPSGTGKQALGYLGLFRPEQRALSWRKAQRLLTELQALMAPGYVQVQGKAARHCPPSLWATGMEQMVERAATLSRPLKNHNYLRQIVWQLADQADAKGESLQRQAEMSGSNRSRPTPAQDMSETTRIYLEKHGEPELPPAIAASLARVRKTIDRKE